MLNDKQLNELKTAYERIRSVNPDRLPQMRSILSKFSRAELESISTANIKFISAIAKNMVNEQKKTHLVPR